MKSTVIIKQPSGLIINSALAAKPKSMLYPNEPYADSGEG